MTDQTEKTHHEWSVESEVIERNSVRCDSCGDEIESTHRHDFRACKCGRVLVDGGKDYRKRGYQGDGGPTYTDTSIYEVFRVEYVDLDEVSRTLLRRVDDSTPPANPRPLPSDVVDELVDRMTLPPPIGDPTPFVVTPPAGGES